MALWQFVDSIAASPTVRLDLNSGPLRIGPGFDLSPAPVRRAVASSTLADGDLITSWSYGNRTLVLPVQMNATSKDHAAALLQSLAREITRDTNIMRVQLGSTPYFFKTYAAPNYTLAMLKTFLEVGKATLEIPAQPFALGTLETFPDVLVQNDPAAEGATLNANPFFETNANNWTPTGGTFVRSTAQFHEGAASGLLTPDGVTANVFVLSEDVTGVAPGTQYRVSSWVRCAVARTVDVGASWSDAAGAFISATTTAVALSATTWTLIDDTFTAPANAAKVAIRVRMTGTPPASHLLHIDEARIRRAGGPGGMCWDVTGVKGDVETPAIIQLSYGDMTATGPAVLAVRRRPGSAVPLVLQCETMTLGTDTTLPGPDSNMSGSGSNYARVSFATDISIIARVTSTTFPALTSSDNRGTYRVFLRCRKSNGPDVNTVWLAVTAGGTTRNNPGVFTKLSTNRHWLDLGLISLPVGPDPGGDVAVRGVVLAVHAGRVTGSGNLDLDVLLLVPADDRLAVINWQAASGPTSAMVDGDLDQVWFKGSTGEVYSEGPAYAAGGLPMLSPAVTNRIIFGHNLGGGTITDLLTATVTAVVSYYPRYLFVAPVGT